MTQCACAHRLPPTQMRAEGSVGGGEKVVVVACLDLDRSFDCGAVFFTEVAAQQRRDTIAYLLRNIT